MANYITVDYFKQRNPSLDLSLYTDTTISGMILSASSMVNNYLNVDSLAIEDIVNEKSEGYVDNDHSLTIFTRRRPIISVNSISLVKGNDQINLSISDGDSPKYDIPATKDYIAYPDHELAITSVSIINSFLDLRSVKFFTVTSYRAGYETIPSDIQEATSLFAKEQVARNMNTTGASRIRQGGIDISYNDSSRSGSDSDNVRDAKSILDRYKRVTPFA